MVEDDAEAEAKAEAEAVATWLKCALGTVKANMSNIVDVCPSLVPLRAAAQFSICFAFQRCLHSY